MIKQVTGFLIGLGFGISLIYAIRRLVASQKPAVLATPSATPAITKPTTAVKPKLAEPVAPATPPESFAGESPDRHLEPEAATHTEPETASPRADLTEAAVPENVEVEAPKSTPRRNGRKSTKSEAETAKEDDFTPIHDLGPIFNKKLHEAGIKTYADLAALTPQEIEAKTDISAARIERSQWIQQAAALAKNQTQSEEA